MAIFPETSDSSSPYKKNELKQTNAADTKTKIDNIPDNQSFNIQIPSISLPKGGGALKNIDEKFQVNAVNGTAGFSLPLPFSKTRSDFIPAISLSYNRSEEHTSELQSRQY